VRRMTRNSPSSRGLLLGGLILASFALAGCQPVRQDWISPPAGKAALCRLVGENVTRNNQILRSTFDNPNEPVPFDQLQDEAVLPGGRTYVAMVSSLSDAELLDAINRREITPSYVYEYAERLYRRGKFEEALPLAYSGTISPSPLRYKFSESGIQYTAQTVKQIGADLPSECLAVEICKNMITQRPIYWNNCHSMRYNNAER
jgi:hypothetical protein